MPEIKFSKMHGLGNDFIIVEDKDLPDDIKYCELSKRLCDRHFGIGGDGLIIVGPGNQNQNNVTDTAWRIFNSDGSEPEMCGNGIRCFAKYVYDKGLIDKKEFSVSTLAGPIIPKIEDDGLVTVDMGSPILDPARIPVKLSCDEVINKPVIVDGKEFHINCVSMGNPHCVIFIEEDVDVVKYGALLEVHNLFPQKTNVEFVKVLSKEHIKVDVWERGCGITLACGTGACACSVAAVLNDLTGNKVKVTLPGGDLIITYEREADKVFMSGPAEYAFEGSFQL